MGLGRLLLIVLAFLIGVAPARAQPAGLAGNTLVCAMAPGLTIYIYMSGRSIFQVLSQSENVGFLYRLGGSRSERRPSGLAYTATAQHSATSLSLIARVTAPGGQVAAGTELRSHFERAGDAWTLRVTTVSGGQRASTQGACQIRSGRALPQ